VERTPTRTHLPRTRAFASNTSLPAAGPSLNEPPQ
jgi:hypothetical protein